GGEEGEQKRAGAGGAADQERRRAGRGELRPGDLGENMGKAEHKPGPREGPPPPVRSLPRRPATHRHGREEKLCAQHHRVCAPDFWYRGGRIIHRYDRLTILPPGDSIAGPQTATLSNLTGPGTADWQTSKRMIN